MHRASAIAMNARYGRTTTVMKDRRSKRAKDFKKSWKNEQW